MTGGTPRPFPAWFNRWGVGLPLVLALAAAAVTLSGEDRDLFLLLNRVSDFTGDWIWANLTILGDGLVVAVLFLPLLGVRPDLLWAGFLAAALSTAGHEIIEHFMSLPRPPAVLEEGSFNVIGRPYRMGSFPSGHTTTLWTWVGVLVLGLPLAGRGPMGRAGAWTARTFAIALVLVLGVLGGFSRIAVGVHWPTDVLGGAALGWISAWGGLRLARRFPAGAGRTGQLVLGALLLICALVLAVIDHTGYPGVLAVQRGLAAGGFLAGALGYRRLLAAPRKTAGGSGVG